MPDITASDGTRLHYAETGDPAARPVVLIAGFKAAASSWRYQVKPLERAGHRVIAFDRRGHGASDPGEREPTMERHGRDIHDLLEGLDLRDATLVGQSMGGNAIWALVDRFGTDRVRDLVIVDQTPCMLNHDDWPYGFYDYDASNVDTLFATGIHDPGRFPAKSKGLVRVARMLRALDLPKGGAPTYSDAELAPLADHAKRDWRPVVARADVPVLFVAGAESEVWPSGHADAAAALNPLAQAVVIERDGHAANIEQPAAFSRILLDWLARRTP
ncbi:pimeloyl-ACP methyl ester carboxylesterase [Agromyces flavus]|uniref:Pimeloyl-ACP methyl ester carboxylesterase n=1 Tax=Agromyces flavus TaxID=589382 RepID=A0A1H1ZFH6_9MICO|nr:alpha/beta hydrolase [Agromyces flavus]MCP2367050.1 pimeloyl-ACP methyl ester carboxylesterase [Agromyces flavus]GGI46500.1 arylesterase [Agromyces flavus]SDT31956.1 Pimeloyl-ACP methyl ester carboxylesterase [Agromyces flavus]